VSPILLARPILKLEFSGFSKKRKKFVTFKTRILGDPVIKVTTKVKLHEGNLAIWFPSCNPVGLALNSNAMTVEFVQLIKMSQFRPLNFWQ